MKTMWSNQYMKPCIVVEVGDNNEEVFKTAVEEGAVYFDGEDECLVLEFQDNPERLIGPELYTEESFRRSKIRAYK